MQDSNFTDLIIRKSDFLFRVAFRILGNREDAQDVLSESLAKAWEKRAQLKTYNNLDAVLYSIVKNQSIDAIRKRKQTVEIYGHHIVVDEKEVHRSKTEQIQSIIAKLPEKQQELIHLRMIECLSMEQIADITNMKINTVEVMLSRARKQIRSIYNEKYKTN